jgi:hypothetical protein
MSLLPHNHHGGLFVRASVDAVADCLVRWGNEDRVGRKTTSTRTRASLEQAWALIEPRGWNPDRAVVIPLTGGWTAFFDNHSHEYTPAAEQYVLALRLRTDACWVFCDDKPDSPHRGSAQFILERCGDVARTRRIDVGKEAGRWRLQQEGAPLPFERADGAAPSRPRDRLNVDVLREYSSKLGIPLADPGAYGDEVWLLKWGEQRPADPTSTIQKLLGAWNRARGG